MVGDQIYRSGDVLKFTTSALKQCFYLKKFWIGFPFFVAVLTVAGPFGTLEALNTTQRALYWCGIAGFSLFLALAVSPTVFFFVMQSRCHWSLAALAGGICAGPFVTMFVYFVNMQIVVGIGYGNLDGFWALALACITICVAGTMIFLQVFEQFQHPFEASPERTGSLQQFLARLAPENRGQIVSLQAQGHYIEVVTASGRELLLMRLKDAILELDDTIGRQVHRSWWVAKAAVRSVKREGGKSRLTLQDGRVVPVSQLNVAEVKAWLAQV